MGSYNKVILMGNLTKDPVTAATPSGTVVCTMRLAVNYHYKNKATGETKEEETFVTIVVWGSQAENCQKFLKKGRSVLVDGRLKLREWEDDKKQKHSVLEIVADQVKFLDKKIEAKEVMGASVHTE